MAHVYADCMSPLVDVRILNRGKELWRIHDENAARREHEHAPSNCVGEEGEPDQGLRG
jgi:hypothetical protein